MRGGDQQVADLKRHERRDDTQQQADRNRRVAVGEDVVAAGLERRGGERVALSLQTFRCPVRCAQMLRNRVVTSRIAVSDGVC